MGRKVEAKEILDSKKKALNCEYDIEGRLLSEKITESGKEREAHCTHNAQVISRDSFEGIKITPISLNPYLYAHSDPVNGIDSSEYMSLIEANITQSLTSVLLTGTKLFSLSQRVETVLSFIQLSLDLSVVFNAGAINPDILKDARLPKGIDPVDVAERFAANGAKAIAQGAVDWAIGYSKMSNNSRLNSFLLYMPFISKASLPSVFVDIPSGIKIPFMRNGKRQQIPLKIVFRFPRGASGLLLGIGMEMREGSNTPVRKPLYRMDMHDWHPNRGKNGCGVKENEINAWCDSVDTRYHCHVMKWTRGK